MCRIVICISSNMRKPYTVEDFTVTEERPENGVFLLLQKLFNTGTHCYFFAILSLFYHVGCSATGFYNMMLIVGTTHVFEVHSKQGSPICARYCEYSPEKVDTVSFHICPKIQKLFNLMKISSCSHVCIKFLFCFYWCLLLRFKKYGKMHFL